MISRNGFEPSALPAIESITNGLTRLSRVTSASNRALPLGAGGPVLMLSGETFDWVWRKAEVLPPPSKGREDPKGEGLYRKLLAGRAAREALEEVESYLKNLVQGDRSAGTG